MASEPKTNEDSKPDAADKAEAEPKPKAEAKTEAEDKAEARTKPNAEPKPKAEAKPGTSKPWFRHALTVALALAVLAVAAALTCEGGLVATGGNLLEKRAPSRVRGVKQVEVLTDGVHARHGDHWKSHLTAIFISRRSVVEYDLGEPQAIRAAYLQGDNNDEYVLEASEDGVQYTTLWRAPPAGSPGLQPRFTDRLDRVARYVRVGVGRGDGSFSLTEVQVYSVRPAVFPPQLKLGKGLPNEEAVRTGVLLFALSLGFFLFATSRRAPWAWTGLCALVPVLLGYDLYRTLDLAWPVAGREVSFVRATAAAVAALAILREVISPKRYPASRLTVFGALGIAAAMALGGFYNLGHPQFHDHKNREPLYVHNFDMRVYYPVAKYFPELGFDGVYKGSVAAYVDDVPNLSLDSISRVELRDLKTHRLRRVAEVKGEIDQVKTRFSPQRWEEFKEDMRYFRETMGRRDYLGSMKDHGGNATPVWLAIAHLMFAKTHASNATLLITALLDPLLLLLAFGVVGYTFGFRTMLVSMVMFGANDFYMFGSNWGGATLRHDWMAYLALGICALKLRHWMIGGALLALSASIRAFPALTLVGLLGPVLWWLWEYLRRERKLPSVRVFGGQQQPVLRVFFGVLVGSVALFLFSSLLFSFNAWFDWLAKVSLLDRDPHVNHISLRALVAGSDHIQLQVLQARMPLFVAGIVVCAAAVVLACRSRRLEHAAVLGLLLIPVAFNPANYYIHFVFVLPLLALELSRRQAEAAGRPPVSWYDAGIWWSMLLVCTAQYWAVLERDLELHFQYHTAIFFAGAVALMAVVLRRDFMPALAAAGPTAEVPPAEPTVPEEQLSLFDEAGLKAGEAGVEAAGGEEVSASERSEPDEAEAGAEAPATEGEAGSEQAEQKTEEASAEAASTEDEIPVAPAEQKKDRS